MRALRHACPAAELIWVAGRGSTAYAHALAPLTGGLLDRTIERGGIGRGLRAALGPARVDLFIDTQSHVGTTLALRLLRPRRFISQAADFWLSDARPPRAYRKPRRLIRRLLDLLELATGRPAMPDGATTAPPAAVELAAQLLPPGPRYIAQAVGAGGRHKAWPAEHHVALAGALTDQGHTPVMIVGPAEADLLAPLQAALPTARFPLQAAAAAGHAVGPELTIALGARCAAAVAGDCGGGHMLAASGAPLLSLFGPTDPEKFAPWGSSVRLLRAQDWGGADMAQIPVSAVVAQLAPLLA